MNSNRIIKSIGRRATFANVIACLALFIALSGVSYAAAKLPAKSVGEKQLKKNAVTSSKLKNGTVVGADIKTNTVTGWQVDEGTLGVVPQAATADRAESVSTQAIARVTATTSATNDDPDVARANAKEIPLASHGAISVYAKCFADTDNKRTYFETYARSTEVGSLLYGYSITDYVYGNPSLSPNTPETSRQVSATWANENTSYVNYANAATVIAPDGRGLVFDVYALGRNGSPTDPPKSLPEGNTCAFQLTGVKVG